jgi:hypothetical protein
MKKAWVNAAFLVFCMLDDEGASWRVFCYDGYKMVTLPGLEKSSPFF